MAEAVEGPGGARPPVQIGGLTRAGAVKPLLVDDDGALGGTLEATIYSSAARTATPATVDQTNYHARGVIVVIDCTAVTSTPSVVFTIKGKDEASGKVWTILASAAITGTGTTVLRVFPGGTAAANLVANDSLPRTWQVTAVHGNSDSITYSVGASLLA